MKAFVKAISYYTPETIESNKDIIADFPDWSEKKISGKIGINQRFLSGDLTAGDMALNAAEKLFKKNNIDRANIDVLMLCTQSPDYFLPSTACVLQDKLSLPTTVAAFDFDLGCSGFVYGLAMAKSFIISGMATNVLLLTSETYQKYINKLDRGNRALFSDAATATLVSTDGWAEIGDQVFGTDGSGYKNLIVESGASRLKRQGIEPTVENLKSPDYLYMDGPSIFNFTLEAVPNLVNQLLDKQSLKLEDIDLFVFHQANKYMLKFIREAIGIPEEKFYLCMENFGNTVSSTIPICLYHVQEEGFLSSGKKVLIAGFGVGYSWGGEILTIK